MNITKLSNDIVKGGIKEVLPLEEKNMSPFIAEHISDFEEIIGKRLGNITKEKHVGRYEADIVAEFVDEEGCLIVENKLGQFDHDHLGKALTYMAYLNGKTIIWICDSYYDEHIKAINYLNDITSDEYSFYAIELKFYKIENNEYKYEYNIIAKPDYQVKLLTAQKNREETDNYKANKEFLNKFESILEKNNISKISKDVRDGCCWLNNIWKSINIACKIYSKNNEITIWLDSYNEDDINNLINLLNNSNICKYSKTYGKKRKDRIILKINNVIKYNKKPIECVEDAANNFIEILNYISNDYIK